MALISGQQVRDWHACYPTWRAYVARLYNARFTGFFSMIDKLSFKSVDQKLIEQLREMNTGNGEIRITHQELAIRLGTAREVVSRLLKGLEKDGKLKLSFGRIQILRPL